MSVTINGTSGITYPDASLQNSANEFVNYFTPINNSSAVTDLSLGVGQTAYIDVSAVTSVALYIATSNNQIYEITCTLSGATVSAGNTILSPNNTSYTNFFFTTGVDYASTGTGGQGAYSNGFILAYTIGPRHITAKCMTSTISKYVQSHAHGVNTTPVSYGGTGNSSWLSVASTSTSALDSTTLWTSLGTITFPVANTGRIWVKRLG